MNDAIDEIIIWSRHKLIEKGYTLRSENPAVVLETPWSFILRFYTDAGLVYLKQTPNLLGAEATVIEILRNKFHAPVPEVISENKSLNCFLMKDAGQPLRSLLKHKFNKDLVYKAIDKFTSLQLSVANNFDIFFDAGVPDWRLDKLSSLYENLISEDDLLKSEGLSKTEIGKLKDIIPDVSNSCQELASFDVPQTIVQPDCSDNNILISDMSQKIAIVDLGELSISHPFFSLLNMCYQMIKHYDLSEDDDVYLKIKKECFRKYTNFFKSSVEFESALSVAKYLRFVYWVLATHRLVVACGRDRVIPVKPFLLGNSLKSLISNNVKNK